MSAQSPPLMPLNAPSPGPGGGNQATIDEAGGAEPIELSIWQRPFVQSVLPFLTSLLVHVAIILIGWHFYTVYKKYTAVTQEQYIIPDSGNPDQEGPVGGVPHPGLNGDPTRDAAQDKFPDAPKDSTGISDSKDMTAELAGGGDESSDGVIATGPGAMFGSGKGAGSGAGTGTGGGGLAPFGIPGGGGGGLFKSNFAGSHGTGMKIVFVCDATGSMMEQFDNLRRQLRLAIEPLRPPQSVNVVFIQEKAAPPIDPNLLFASPANKRRLLSYVDGYTPRGPTDPVPALKAAFAMKPDLIYLLCDPSDFPDPKSIIDLCKTLNAEHKTKVNTICFDTHEGEATLKQISADSGGSFKNISAKELGGD